MLPKIGNAIDALEESFVIVHPSLVNNKEQITKNIDASVDSHRVGQIHIFTELTDSNTAIIRIADNGSGMTKAVQDKIFDPFFTTKSVGSGTGLGLSISHQIIVDKHKGRLTCDSTLGKGTEFVIEIPMQQSDSYKI